MLNRYVQSGLVSTVGVLIPNPLLVHIAVGVLLVCGLPARVVAGPDVLAGHDLFHTQNGASQDFSSTPIPADFFFPGSAPFTDIVDLQGVPLGSWNGHSGLGNTDTIVARLDNALLPVDPPPDRTAVTIDIEIVALSLTSVSPIAVTGTAWDLFIDVDTTTLSVLTPSLGTMDITQTSAMGGFVSAHLEVFPRFTFVEVGNPTNQRILDFGNDVPGPALDFNTTNNPTWEYTPTHNQLVVPGLTGPNFYIFGPIHHTATYPIEIASPEPSTLMLCVLAGVGLHAYGWRRRRSA